MSKRSATNIEQKKAPMKLVKVKKKNSLTEYILPKSGLRVLYMYRPKTGVITTDIVYKVGSRDEDRGETGIAHMLEHMLFKPTQQDLKRGSESAAMDFERETGATLNANTWKDRTSYYFSYPKEHFNRALQIEAERMQDVVLTDLEFLPERTNVLSEFDMYAGDEQFSLSVEMMSVAFRSHTYGHETIGYREDIEAYTTDKLQKFYKKFYAPHNAVLIIVGDVKEQEMQEAVLKHFGNLKQSPIEIKRAEICEPKQEGIRSVTIKRPSTTQVYAHGVRHEGFPSKAWFETMIVFEMLASGDDSILHKKLIDKGLATNINVSLEPSREKNLAILFVTLNDKMNHESMQKLLPTIIHDLTLKEITPYLQKTIAKALTSEFISRENSLGICSELVEYVSADSWEDFFNSEKILSSITAHDIKERIQLLFTEENTTIGYFKGTK